MQQIKPKNSVRVAQSLIFRNLIQNRKVYLILKVNVNLFNFAKQKQLSGKFW